ncbi:helix-turn-helix domain-containing protein [Halobacteriales archaeon QS_5_70_15]|nr:MAG: helix-turn-helix domain-containing protein [Halobacteriales archaeon QS_5_70_15]
MNVIAELRVAAEEFELGRILHSARDLDIELETMVPLRQRPVPFLVVHDDASDLFEARVGKDPSVEDVKRIERHDGETLYALDWKYERDDLFGAMDAARAHLLSGRTSGDRWGFELRFGSRDALARFDELCEESGVEITVDSIYNPTRPGKGLWFGLTDPQRETLVRAVEGGYYDIPRGISTKDLAEEFGVSDQAVTERLRRAIVALTESTVMVAEDEAEETT